MSTKAAAERLADAVATRRQYLAETQLDIAARGGPSNSTQTKIEAGELVTLTNATAKKIDKGLMWRPGSAMGVWRDGDAPLPVGAGSNDSGYVSAPGDRAPGGSSDDEVLAAIRQVHEELRAMRERLDRIDGS